MFYLQTLNGILGSEPETFIFMQRNATRKRDFGTLKRCVSLGFVDFYTLRYKNDFLAPERTVTHPLEPL